MAKTALRRILDDLERLTPDEQKQLREALDRLLSVASLPPTEEEFERELVESGFLERIAAPPVDVHDVQEENPIDIQGRPLSETVIEDRR
jgi:hypothetical protein